MQHNNYLLTVVHSRHSLVSHISDKMRLEAQSIRVSIPEILFFCVHIYSAKKHNSIDRMTNVTRIDKFLIPSWLYLIEINTILFMAWLKKCRLILVEWRCPVTSFGVTTQVETCECIFKVYVDDLIDLFVLTILRPLLLFIWLKIKTQWF